MKNIQLTSEALDAFENERARAEQISSFLLLMQIAFEYGDYDVSAYLPAVSLLKAQAREHELELNSLVKLLCPDSVKGEK